MDIAYIKYTKAFDGSKFVMGLFFSI